MKYTFHLKQNAHCPITTTLDDEKILLNDVIFPYHIDSRAYNPHNVRLFVIGHEFGAMCAVWASHEQDAFDEACDAGFLEFLLAENQTSEDDSLASFGNASELHDVTNVWIGEVEWEPARDIQLIVAMLKANGDGDKHL